MTLNKVAIGVQNFEKIVSRNYFYIDKTAFIKEWWDSGDVVTLITRPRRFGKTLNMSMLECFFSNKYAGRGDLFEELSIWEDEEYREIQGSYPVINLSFSDAKGSNYLSAKQRINYLIANLYNQYWHILESGILKDDEKKDFLYVTDMKRELSEESAATAIQNLSHYIYRYYGKKVIILLDEYDTPMHEAYAYGYWDELVDFMRNLFYFTFQSNPYLERAIMIGITYADMFTPLSPGSKSPCFHNPKVVTITSDKYATAFGFTEEEVFAALDVYKYDNKKEDVKLWYDGFVFGTHKSIYNPWSITNFLDKGKIDTYWANTSSNQLVGKLIQEGNNNIKCTFESLLKGETIHCPINKLIVYSQSDYDDNAVWSLLLASGYLKVISYEQADSIVSNNAPLYELAFTNHEMKYLFYKMVRDWFAPAYGDYYDFIKSMFADDLEAMNAYMDFVSEQIFSDFVSGKTPSSKQPEWFYHGFVLGLIVDLAGKYVITSNRESGFGRYDVVIEPVDKEKNAIILEFKVFQSTKEKNLEETVQSALAQIEAKHYEADLIARGFRKEQIRKYGFAFEGKTVLIGD